MVKSLKLSKREEIILNMLRRNSRSLPVSVITKKVFKGQKKLPKDPNNSIIVAANRLDEKLRRHRTGAKIIGVNRGRQGKILILKMAPLLKWQSHLHRAMTLRVR